MCFKRRILLFSLLALIPFSKVVFADGVNVNSSTESLTLESGVTMQKASWFKVTIPKKITLNGSPGAEHTVQYQVSVEGDLSGHDTIYVKPETSFTMKDNAGIKEIDGFVSQNDTSFTIAKIGTLNTSTTGTVSTPTVEAGKYGGNFNFEIYKEFVEEHVWGGWVQITPPTCISEGLQRRTCTICNGTEDQVLPKSGHNYTAVVTSPTCTEQGYTTYTCTRCGDTYKDNYTSVLAHTPKSAVTENKIEATCYSTGSYQSVVYCSVCNTEISRTDNTIAKTAHEYESSMTTDLTATCQREGKQSQHCKNYSHCGAKTNETTIAKRNHRASDWVSVGGVDVCTQSDTMRQTCLDCGTLIAEKQMPALGHSYYVEYYYCSSCSKHFDSIPTSHTNNSGATCTGTIYAYKVCLRNNTHTTTAIAYQSPKTNPMGETSGDFDVRVLDTDGKTLKYGSTYSNGGYHTYITIDSTPSKTSKPSTKMSSNKYSSGDISIERTYRVDDDERVEISYIVKNSGTTSHKVSIGFCADVQVNGDDHAPIYSNSQGLYMVGTGNVTFQLYAFNTLGVSDMDRVWAGAYSGYEKHVFDDSSSQFTSDDSAMAASWVDRTIPAGTTITFTCKLGLL